MKNRQVKKLDIVHAEHCSVKIETLRRSIEAAQKLRKKTGQIMKIRRMAQINITKGDIPMTVTLVDEVEQGHCYDCVFYENRSVKHHKGCAKMMFNKLSIDCIKAKIVYYDIEYK